LGGVFYDQNRIGDPANPSDQSLSGAVARLAGTGDPPRVWWLVAVLVVGLAGLAVAVWAHRRGHRMAGLLCCAVTGLLVSPISWTHHWVWAVPLPVGLSAAAWRCRSAAWALAAAVAAAVFSDSRRSPGQATRPTRRGWWPATCTCCSAWPCWGRSAWRWPGGGVRTYRRTLTRAMSLSMSEDSVGF